jgi:cell division septation protein DedD
MNRISQFQIPLGSDAFRAAAADGADASLAEPLQALVAAVTRRCAEGPLAIYLAAADDARDARDEFAFALARALTAHVPSTLLVDCDFLAAGLGGRVPQKDALGFLDFLLYGSSIGVITQDAAGVHVVGAGSFPVTKRMPFVDTAFGDASRRLVAHARCALFVGPLHDEAGEIHPLCHDVDVVATVRGAARDPRLDAAEEKVASGRPEVWSLRLGAAPEPVPAATPVAAPIPAAPRSASEPSVAAPARPERTAASLWPRVAVLVFGLLVISFVVWQLRQNRPAPGEGDGGGRTTAAVGTAPDTARVAMPDSTPADTMAAPPVVRPDTLARAGDASPRLPANPADTGGRTGGTVLVNPADIQVMDDLARSYRGWYVIHISSFQESIRARDEVAFLQSREFPVFIVFLDLGAKGKWYRVYAGPFATREEAREVKKNLDAVPQVRFTRITTIPE